MGTWGTGLYQNDTAEDLKPLIGQLLRLPMSEDAIVDIVVAEVADDEDATDIWLILADQFEKKGVVHQPTFGRALNLIERGVDITRLRGLDMSDGDLAKRQTVLNGLAARLHDPKKAVPRKTMTKPKPIPVASGDVVAYPVDAKGGPVNPYFSPALVKKFGFTADGWCVTQVVQTGHEFGYLPWIAVLTSHPKFADRPSMGDVDVAKFSRQPEFGTLSPQHFKKMGMEKIGVAPIPADLAAARHGAHTARSVALSDVSVSNALMRNVWHAA